MEFKEIITEAGSYRITKDVNGNVYSIAVANEDADDGIKEFMRDAINKRIAADARERTHNLESPLYASIDGSVIVSKDTIEFTYNG